MLVVEPFFVRDDSLDIVVHFDLPGLGCHDTTEMPWHSDTADNTGDVHLSDFDPHEILRQTFDFRI